MNRTVSINSKKLKNRHFIVIPRTSSERLRTDVACSRYFLYQTFCLCCRGYKYTGVLFSSPVHLPISNSFYFLQLPRCSKASPSRQFPRWPTGPPQGDIYCAREGASTITKHPSRDIVPSSLRMSKSHHPRSAGTQKHLFPDASVLSLCLPEGQQSSRQRRERLHRPPGQFLGPLAKDHEAECRRRRYRLTCLWLSLHLKPDDNDIEQDHQGIQDLRCW